MRTHAKLALVAAVTFVVTYFLLIGVGTVWAQDSTVVVDRTGIFGPVIDNFWPVIVTFLTSLTVKIVAQANAGFARTSEPVKWAALYFFALAYNLLAHWLNISAVDPSAPMFGLAMVQTVAAAVVYKFGQHSVAAV